jgi:HEAT repeat protein/energy-coupling factor transporter ATP-binding protein EcfA2
MRKYFSWMELIGTFAWEIPTMIDNRKEEYTHEVNRHTKNIIDGLIPKRIVPFDYYEERDVDEEIKNWIERSEGEFAAVVGDAGFGKTSLLCNLANELLKAKEEHYTVFFVKSENFRGKEFDKKILDDLEITEIGLNALLRKIEDENEKIFFLLDTLDVIAADEGIARLDDFLIKIKGENRVVIGASRPLEFKRIEHLTRKTFELKPFSDDEIRRLFDKYKAFYKMEGVELGLPVLEVCRNPLHMRMLFEVYQPNEIPEDINTQKLYDRYWEKKVAEIRIGALSHLDAGKNRKAEEVKEDLAKNIAAEMLASKQIMLSKSDIKNIKDAMREDDSKIQYAEVKNSTDVTITQTIKELIIEYDTIINDAYHDLLDEGVLREQADSVEFFHQSFFEYAVARALIEKGDEEQLEYLFNNTTLLENRGIILQVILYAKRKKKDEMAYKFLKTLSETNLYTKILAIDLLKHIENILENEVEIYQSVARDEIGMREYLAGSLKDVIPKHPRVASGLIETLCRDESRTVRRVVAEALPELFEVNPELATALIGTLSRDEDYFVRRTAAKALPKLVEENPEVAIGLVETLSKDDDAFVRGATAEVLAKLFEENPEVVTGLIKSLSKDDDAFVRGATTRALVELSEVNPEVASRFETLSRDKDEYARGTVALGSSKWFEAKNAIIAVRKTLSGDEGRDVRGTAASALPALVKGNPEVATMLVKTLSRDNDASVRCTVARALIELIEVNPKVETGLIETLSRDKDSVVRRVATEALLKLAELYPQRAHPMVERLKDVEYIEIQKAITEIIRRGLLRS